VATMHKEHGRLIVKVPYNSSFIDELKAKVPARFRRWNEEEKVWVVNEEYANEVERLVKKFFEVEMDKEVDGWYATLHLRPSAPFELVVAAYETLLETLEDEAEKAKVRVAYFALSKLLGEESKEN